MTKGECRELFDQAGINYSDPNDIYDAKFEFMYSIIERVKKGHIIICDIVNKELSEPIPDLYVQFPEILVTPIMEKDLEWARKVIEENKIRFKSKDDGKDK